MKITRVEPIILDGLGIYEAFLVRVHTDEGLVGLGQGVTAANVARAMVQTSNPSAVAFNDLLAGECPLHVRRLWQMMFDASYQYGRDGVALHVISAIDMALWDIAAQAADLPLCDLLGGRYSDNIEVYASYVMPNTPEEVTRFAEQALQAGMGSMKLGWGPLGADIGRDVELLAAARDVLGPSRRLMVDGGMAYTVKRARQLCERAEHLNLFWFEEPFDAEDLLSYRRLSDSVSTPIAAGEAHSTLGPFKALIEEGRVDVLQPDLGRCGGFTTALDIGALARLHSVLLVPHCYSDGVLLAASLHFAAATGTQCFVEYPMVAYDRDWSPTAAPLRPVDGHIRLPGSSGLGVTLDEHEVERRRLR